MVVVVAVALGLTYVTCRFLGYRTTVTSQHALLQYRIMQLRKKESAVEPTTFSPGKPVK